MHVFVDDSSCGPYLLCAVTVEVAALGSARRVLRGLLKSGERRIHFNKESPGRRREILSALVNLGGSARLFIRDRKPLYAARADCLNALMGVLIELNARRLVLESVQVKQDREDARLIAGYRAKLPDLVYDHMAPSGEPLLWAADAIARAYGAGGDWRRRVEKLVTSATYLGDKP